MPSKKRILITGAAGFIGFHLSRKLCGLDYLVTGIDNLNDYYDPNLKQARLDLLKQETNFDFKPIDLTDREGLNRLFAEKRFQLVVNLAAQAGVRSEERRVGKECRARGARWR